MSNDNNNSDPFDFDFDMLNADEPKNTGTLKSTGESSFDLDNPFGNDAAVPPGDENTFESDAHVGDDFVASDSAIGADNPYLQDAAVSADAGKADKKKKSGWFSKSKDKPVKEKTEKPLKEAKPKKEKIVKEKKPAGEPMPQDWGTILCIAFSVFLLASLLMLNIGALLTSKSLMQTICFLGAFNVVGLAAAAVPILFYKLPKERTLPNIMLGIAAVAMFGGLLLLLTECNRYSFILKP